MRHRNAGRQFSRNTSHRKAMFRALTANLVAHERIETTDAKAKELKRVAERLITHAVRLGEVAYTPQDKLSPADKAKRHAAQAHMGRFLRRFAVVKQLGEDVKIDQVEKALASLKLLAPAPGIVVYNDPGFYFGNPNLMPGRTVWNGMILLNLVKPETMEAKCFVLEKDAGELRQGQIQSVEVDRGLSILAVVGDGMAGAHGVAAKVFSALGDAAVNVRAIAQGASERNISVVIDGRSAAKALSTACSTLL